MKRVASSVAGCCVDKDKKARSDSSGDKLVVAMLNGESVEIAYGEEEKRMAFWEFLSKRLYPAFKGMMYWDAEEVRTVNLNTKHKTSIIVFYVAYGSHDVLNKILYLHLKILFLSTQQLNATCHMGWVVFSCL